VDLQPAASSGGENWGWRCREGAHPYDATHCDGLVFVDPIHEYTHGGQPSRCAIVGGEVYRGAAIPDLRGSYFFADNCSAQIWSIVNGAATDLRDRTGELASGGASIDQISSFGRDARGEIYVIDQGGQVYRIAPAAPPAPGVPATSPLGAAALGTALAFAAALHLRRRRPAPPEG
jgi:hypothetical protein